MATPPEDIVPGAIGGSEHVCGAAVEQMQYGRERLTRAAKDPVIVTPFEDGGLISYRKADGTFLHTLNTREGFERKLRQLGIR